MRGCFQRSLMNLSGGQVVQVAIAQHLAMSGDPGITNNFRARPQHVLFSGRVLLIRPSLFQNLTQGFERGESLLLEERGA